MPRWFTRTQIEEMKSVFTYIEGEDGYRALLELWGPDKPAGGGNR